MAQQDKGRTRDVDNIVGGNRDKLVINVRTVPNGYTLDIEKGEKKQGFMYFNPKKLLDGFIYHVGFEEQTFLFKSISCEGAFFLPSAFPIGFRLFFVRKRASPKR